MLTEDWMTRDVITVKPLEKAARAAELMDAKHIHQLPVVSEDRGLAGIITDRDIRLARGLSLGGKHPMGFDGLDVEEVMTVDPLIISPGDDLMHALQLLHEHRFGALPVVQGGKLVGIIARHDLLAAFVSILSDQSGPEAAGSSDRAQEVTHRASQ